MGQGARALAAPVDVDVTVTVDVTERHQKLVGFGGAVAFYTNFLSPRNDDIFKVLFVDLGIDILRIANWYQNQTASGTTPDTAFTDTASAAIVQKATAAMGHPPKILMSSWSPPGVFEEQRAHQGITWHVASNGGHLRLRAIRRLVGAIDRGVHRRRGSCPITSAFRTSPISSTPAGRPASSTPPRTRPTRATAARWTPSSAAIAGSTLDTKPKLVGPENSGANNGVQRYLNNMSAASFDVVAHHLYNGGMAGNDPAPDSFATAMTNVASAASNAGGKPIFMTEFAPQAPSLLNTAWMIQDALTTEGVSAYIYWGLIWAPPAAGAAPAGLVTIAGADPSSPYTINDTYYAMKHFARWTDPDWVRVGAASSVDAVRSSAFVSPDGASLTVVLLNTDSVRARRLGRNRRDVRAHDRVSDVGRRRACGGGALRLRRDPAACELDRDAGAHALIGNRRSGTLRVSATTSGGARRACGAP